MLMDECVMQAGKNLLYLGITILILNQICMTLLALDKSALHCNFFFFKPWPIGYIYNHKYTVVFNLGFSFSTPAKSFKI